MGFVFFYSSWFMNYFELIYFDFDLKGCILNSDDNIDEISINSDIGIKSSMLENEQSMR